MTEQMDIAKRYIEVPPEEGQKVLEELTTDDYVNHDVRGGDLDKSSAPEAWDEYYRAFPDIQFKMVDAFESGDRVVVRWRMKATHQGPLEGEPPTGRSATMDGVSILRLEGGRIAEDWTYYDWLTVLEQLGLTGPRAPSPQPRTEPFQPPG